MTVGLSSEDMEVIQAVMAQLVETPIILATIWLGPEIGCVRISRPVDGGPFRVQ